MMLPDLDTGPCGVCDLKPLGGRHELPLSSPWISVGCDGNSQKADIELWQ